MLSSILSGFLLAQTVPAPEPQPPRELVIPQQTRPLPGQLDRVPVFNSNNPEIVKTEGILLSTFPPTGKRVPEAHLNFLFNGRFDVFSHHIARAIETPNDLRSLHLGVIVFNPGTQPVTLDILQAASYLSQPDAPFVPLPPMQENNRGTIFAGPGDRAMNEVLRGQRQEIFPAQIVIPPQSSRMLMNLPIPVRPLTPPLNGRSTLMRLYSTAPVYVANLALFAKQNPDGTERAPTLADWQDLVQNGGFAGPREGAPSPPDNLKGAEIYGRVAAVAQGSRWRSRLTDPNRQTLAIPPRGQEFSYGLSTLLVGKMGTGQNQSAKLLVRYPGTAYEAHGNYAIEYNLTLPLINSTSERQRVSIRFQTPIKEDNLSQAGLRFRIPPFPNVFFRGTVRIRYTDDRGLPQTRYWHLVQQRGQLGDPLAEFSMEPGDRRLVQVDFLYPPDATPPQMLTLQTLDYFVGGAAAVTLP